MILIERLMTARHRCEKCLEYVVVFKGLSNNDVVVGRDNVVPDIHPGVGFKARDFVNEKLGGLPWNNSTRDVQKLFGS